MNLKRFASSTVARIAVIATIMLAGCSPAEATSTEAIGPIRLPTDSSTQTVAPTQMPTVPLGPTTSPSPAITSTPAWQLISDFAWREDEVLLLEVPQGTRKDDYRFQDSACPLRIAGFSLDMMVEPTEANSDFGAQLDLHGLGSVRSWYAQMGYHFQNGQLNYYCQAYSYSSVAPRYWRSVGPAQFDTWTNFEIEVVPVEDDWGYAFRYLIDGDEVCYYQPPSDWDGNNLKLVIWRAAAVWLPEPNPGTEPIRVLADNYEGFVSPSCRPVR